MKTEAFINALELQNIVPAEVIQKLRAKIGKTDKNISAKSVAKYLIEKGYLSRYQAKLVFESADARQDEIELQVPREQIDDTNELLKDLNPAGAAQAPDDATRAFSEQDAAAHDDASIDVVQVEHEMTMQQGLQPGGMEVHAHEAMDPLGGGVFDNSLGEAEVSESPLDSFSGKKAKKNQWDSKWMFIGSTILALLIMVGVILAFTIFKADAAKLWAGAIEDFNNQRYSIAIEKFQRYIKKFPRDDKVPDARVKIVNCELRIPYDSGQWDTTLVRSQTALPDLQDELEKAEEVGKLGDLRPELGVILPGAALGFTFDGIDADDVAVKREKLKLAREMMVLINNPAYLPTSERNKPGVSGNLDELENNIRLIERQIEMERDYVAALDTMKTLTEQGNTRGAFETFESLVATYPDLRIRDEIQDAMQAISLREAELVKTIDVILDPPVLADSAVESSVILATKSGRGQIAGLSNEMLVHLIDGSVYGIRAVDGHVVWRLFVGVETAIEPVWLGDENKSDVVVTDGRQHHLTRVGSSDGGEIWRIAIGEPFAAPNVTPNGILLTTISGKVMQIDSETGEISRAAQIPKTASVSGVAIPNSPFIYQLANDSNIYIISTETMTCREVYFLGHASAAVRIPPYVISGHLIIAENGADYCNLRILRPVENGLKLETAQPAIRLTGKVTTPFTNVTRWGLVMSDDGDLRMLEVNKINEEQPVSIVVRKKFSNKNLGRNYLKAIPGMLWVCGSGVHRYKIKKAAGEFSERGVANNLDVFVGTPSLIGETFFHVRRRTKSALVSVSAVDSSDLSEIWRTDFSAPLAGPPVLDGSGVLAVSSQGDVFRIDDQAVNDGAVNRPQVRGSTVMQSLVFNNVVKIDSQFVVTGPLDRTSVLTVDFNQNPPTNVADLQQPANNPSCHPVAFGSELLVPTLRGQVFRVNPLTGLPVGAPFQPPLEPNTQTIWRTPVIVEDGLRFIIGDADGRVFLVEADGKRSLQKRGELQMSGELLSPLAKLANAALGVIRDDTGDHVFSIPFADTPEVSGQADLPGGYVAGPIPISDDRFIVFLDTGDTVCFDSSLSQQWSSRIPPQGLDRMAGEPVSVDGKLVMAFESGKLYVVDPDNGEVVDSMDVGQPISYPPVEWNGQLIVAGADGTLHRIPTLK